MLIHPKTPLIVGSALIGGLVWSLTQYSPMPGDLSSAHARIEGAPTLAGCAACHAAEGGLDAGCLSCHGEIAAQLAEDRGYHDYLIGEGAPACARCHQEHKGEHHDLVNEVSWGAQVAAAFRHPHADFALVGAHERLACATCHAGEREGVFALAGFAGTPRTRTFLGLEQACARCHDDPHAGGLAADCARCHAQESFAVPRFDHDVHFPLTGGHVASDCRDCHAIPAPDTPPRPAPFPFDAPRGETCAECHQTPHRALSERCETCHPGDNASWPTALGRMGADAHRATGFLLEGPHREVACASCHARDLDFAARYPDPAAPGYLRQQESCQGCHEDVHRGQFAGRYARCLDCHEQHRFTPTLWNLERHAGVFRLTGAHPAQACTKCHTIDAATGARRFAGTTRSCKGCHESAHGPQFASKLAKGDCTTCHEPTATTFAIRPFDHAARTGHRLEGAHYHIATCSGCHTEVEMKWSSRTAKLRRYEDTPTACASCHKDVHRGQFDVYGVEQCSRCHTSQWRWSETRFDHDTQARFKLEGAHAKVACDRCHLPVVLEDGSQVIQYRPIAHECRSCHDIPTADR